MPSQRNDLKDMNANSSKNTRMDIDHAGKELDYRKDEIMHIARYVRGAQTMVDLAKQLGRPIRVLDIGCGQMNTVRLFYKSYVEKKSDIIEQYVGIKMSFYYERRNDKRYPTSWASLNRAKKLLDWIYSEETLCLKRKYLNYCKVKDIV